MPSLGRVLARFTKQRMLYFENQGDNASGRPTYADPVIVPCRWEDKVQEVLLKDSRRTISKAYILVGIELKEGSIVFLGPTFPSTDLTVVADWKATSAYPSPPTQNEGGREIILVKTTPDIGALSRVFEVYL